MNPKIINYQEKYKKDLKKLMIKFHQYLIDIDFWKVFKMDKEYKKKATDALLKTVKEKKGKILLVKEGKNIIGYIAGYVLQDKENIEVYPLKSGYIDELFIEEKYRGNKLGEKLLGIMGKYFKDKRCDTIGFNALIANPKAIAFYEKHGFEGRSLFLAKALNKKVRK